MLSKEQMAEFAREKGFDSLAMHSGDKKWYKYMNYVDSIALDIYPVEEQVELVAVIGTFTLRSGRFSFNHPRHDEQFQNKFEDILEALEQFRN